MRNQYYFYYFKGIDLSLYSFLKFKLGLEFAIKAHFGQKRKSGEDYIIHPIQVGEALWNKFFDFDLTLAGFLHDTIEDCVNINEKIIFNFFGKNICFLVDSVTKNRNSFYLYPKVNFEDKTLRLLWAGKKDVRVFLLKIEDRTNNLSTLSHLKPNKQIRMAFETQAIYRPLRKVLKPISSKSLLEVQQNFDNFLKEKNFSDLDEFKSYLFSKTFENMNENLFSYIYKNSSSVVWRVEGMHMYQMLINMEEFKDKITILNVKGNSKWLHVDFKFKKGSVTYDENLKMKISSFKI